MKNWLIVFSTVIIGFGSVFFQSTAGEDHEMKYASKPMIVAWVEKPPYTTSPSNDSLDDKAIGMIRDAILQYIKVECGKDQNILYQVKTTKFATEFEMIRHLRQNKVHIAAPIFEPSNNRKYSEFPFFKLDDYPGTEYITTEDETNALNVVLKAVERSWPLFAVTLVLTAIAGIVMWCLVGPVVEPSKP